MPSDDIGLAPSEVKCHNTMREIGCLSVAYDGDLFDPFDAHGDEIAAVILEPIPANTVCCHKEKIGYKTWQR